MKYSCEQLDEMEFTTSAISNHKDSNNKMIETITYNINQRIKQAEELTQEMKDFEARTFMNQVRREIKHSLLDIIESI